MSSLWSELSVPAASEVRSEAASAVLWKWRDLEAEESGEAEKGEEDQEGGDEAAGLEVEARVRAAYRKGLSEGRSLGEAGVEPALQLLRRTVKRLEEERARWREERPREVATLALTMARIVLERELAQDPERFASYVQDALSRIPVDQSTRIRIHPEDLALLAVGRSPEGDEIPVAGSRDVAWVADPDVERCGCLLEGEDRIIDGRIDRTLRRLYEAATDG